MTFPRPRELGEHVGGKDGLVAQYMVYISNSIVNNLKMKNKRWGGGAPTVCNCLTRR